MKDNHKESLNRLVDAMTKSDTLEEAIAAITDKIIEEVYKRIRKNTPELMMDISESYKETTRLIHHIQETFLPLERKLKKIVDSPSLYQDVYKMRDELLEIKKLLEKMEKK